MHPNKKAQPIRPSLLRRWKLPLEPAGDKDDRGCVLVVGGAPELPGAVILAATCALRAGAGRLQIATDESIAQTVATVVPESLVTTLAKKKITALYDGADAMLIGPGLAKGPKTGALVKSLLSTRVTPSRLSRRPSKKTVILDAEALQTFRRKIDWLAKNNLNVIVTPHAGEMASMLGTSKSAIEAAPDLVAIEFAKMSGAVTVLKGSTTYIATSDGELYRNDRGNFGLATSGSGDCLAGLIAGLAARGAPPLHAAAWGVYLHARAGEVLARKVGSVGYLAREIPTEVPKLMDALS